MFDVVVGWIARCDMGPSNSDDAQAKVLLIWF